jgi:hypothetical protein
MPEEESLPEAVPVTDIPVFEEDTSAPVVADAAVVVAPPVVEPEPQAVEEPATSEAAHAELSTAVEMPVVPALEKPKRVTKSTKQTVKAGAQRDLFDF